MAEDVIVIGGGKVGTYLSSVLLAEGHPVTLIEASQEMVAALGRSLPTAKILFGSGTDPAALEAAHIRQAGVVAAVTGSDEVNLVVTSLARCEFGVPRTIARVNDPRNAWLFTAEMGVDVAVSQADLIAYLIAEEISVGDVTTLLKLHKGEYSLVEEKVHPTAAASGKALRELEIPAECVLAAVLRQGRLIVPKGDTVLEPGDEVLAVVRADRVPRLAALLGRRTADSIP